jgi:hypothetical protein
MKQMALCHRNAREAVSVLSSTGIQVVCPLPEIVRKLTGHCQGNGCNRNPWTTSKHNNDNSVQNQFTL